MKKSISSWVFATVVLALGGYSFYEYRYAEDKDPSEKHMLSLFSLYAPDVNLVKVQKMDAAPLTLIKKNDKWVVSGAFEDQADLQLGVAFVVGLVGEKAKIGKKDGEIQWKEYGLENPAYLIEVEDSKGGKESIAISSLQAFDGNYFIKKNGQLLIGGKSWDQLLSRNFNFFREKKLYRDPFNPISIDVLYNDHGLKQKFTLQKEDSGWVIAGKNMKNYDSHKIEQIIEEIKNLRANDYTQDAALPIVTSRLELKGPEGKNWWIELGPEQKGLVYAKCSAVQGLVQLTPGLIEKIKVSLDDLRNGRLPFQFDLTQVDRVKINDGVTKLNIKKTDMDQEAAVSFFQGLQNLNAQKMLAKEPFKIKFNKSIQLISANDKEILLIRWSDELQDNQNKVVYAQTSKSYETLVLSAGDFASLGIQNLVKPKTEDQPTEAKKEEVSDESISNKN